MKRKLRQLWKRFVFSRQEKFFKILYNISYGFRNNVEVCSNDFGLFIPTKGRENINKCVYLARPSSAFRFRKGVENRLKILSREYFLDAVPVADYDVVVDVGANIGEIGLYYQWIGKKIRYVYVEPEEKEINACRLNNPKQICISGVLWENEKKNIEIFHAPETEDSSLIKSSMHHSKTWCDAFTLESVLNRYSIDSVKLLKLEAEGAEPEVLYGAKPVLSNIQYITADLGPERGYSGECTVEIVTNFLLQNGFQLLKLNHFGRLVGLFKRS